MREIQLVEHDISWGSIALIAYLFGVAVEGVSTTIQLLHSASELDQPGTGNPHRLSWQIIAAIACVSICGAFCWPCRLFHRSIRGL